LGAWRDPCRHEPQSEIQDFSTRINAQTRHVERVAHRTACVAASLAQQRVSRQSFNLT
jgi:hypothetical protein